MFRRTVRVTIILASAVLAAVAGTVTALLNTRTIYEGVRVGGVHLGGLTLDEARACIGTEATSLSTPLILRYPGGELNTTLGAVGARLNATACAHAAYQIGRTGNLFQRISDILAARRNGIEIPAVYEFDTDIATGVLREIARQVDRPPTDARISIERGGISIVSEKPGFKLYIPESLAQIEKSINAGQFVIEVVAGSLPPKIVARDFEGIDGVIAEFSTPYNPSQRDRTHNLRLACAAVNRTLLKPGQIFSYNKIVGPRSEKRGFRYAPMFVRGEVEAGIGGGVCQVSSTVYNAALLANMKILKRTHHSRPVTYVGVGRDATVAYPSPDLQFMNTSDSPIYILASVEANTVHVTILGRKVDGREIEIVVRDHKVVRAPTIQRVDNNLQPGQRVVRQGGRAGHRVTVYRVVKVNGTPTTTEFISNDYYPPEARITMVGPSASPPANAAGT